MSLTTATLKRLPTIKNGIMQGDNREEIAASLHVNEKTIDRDIARWVDSGLFEVWIKEEFLRLHQLEVHNNPDLAYAQVSKLVGQMLTRKIEKTVDVREIKLSWNVNERIDSNDSVQTPQGTAGLSSEQRKIQNT